MKNILCLDTISPCAGITIIHDESAHHLSLNPLMASEGIIELIDTVMKEARIEVKDLNGVMVIKGPGSFTGLRVGIAVANQFAHQLKIPIVGLTTDEWWNLRSGEMDKIYLQSMNKQELYIADETGARILALEELIRLGKKKWLGELKFDHLEKLPLDFEAINEMESIEDTWGKALQSFQTESVKKKAYDLIEPFYGKEPNITKAKLESKH